MFVIMDIGETSKAIFNEMEVTILRTQYQYIVTFPNGAKITVTDIDNFEIIKP